MAKGKHAPSKGAIRQEKVLHPTSRKVLKMSKKETHRSNVESKGKIGIQRMSSLAEKLVWIKDSLPAVMDEEGQMTKGRDTSCFAVLRLILQTQCLSW